MDLGSILEVSERRFAASPATVCGVHRWSYSELAAASRRLACGLSASGARPGDRIAILHRNCHRFQQAILGAAWGGFVLMPLNTRLDAASLQEMLRDAGATWLLAEPCFDALAQEAIRGTQARISTVAAIEANGNADKNARSPRLPEDLAQLYYTSGTTGRPRGVMLSHRNIASHAQMTIEELRLSARDVWAHVAPLFHLADAWAAFAITLAGGRHVFFPEFEPRSVLDEFEREGVTITNLVPTMLNRLVADPSAPGRGFPHLRAILSGGAPIAPALVKRILEIFRTEYVQTYGLTETSPYLTFSLLSEKLRNLPLEQRLAFICKTGRPAAGVQLRVVDEQGRDIARDDRAVGEICVQAPWVFGGYWNRPDETKAAFHEGWFRTGDLATWDQEGFVNIVDRKKDMIITGGEKVFSVEVEHALLAHPAVFECAVVGVPDADWGEAVTAVAVLREGANVAASELIVFLKEKLAAFKVPKRVVFLAALPKTGSGKIRKAEIRKEIRAGV